MKKVLISAPYMISDFNKIKYNFDEYDVVIPQVNEKLTEMELLNYVEDIEGVICGDDEFTKKVIDKSKKLKVIVKWGTGIDSINKEYAESKGIKVMNTPGAFTNPVSETTIGLILSFTRVINENNILMKNNVWLKPKGCTLSELTIGIIGFGRIGNKVAEYLKHFDAKIIYYDIDKKNNNIAIYTELNNLLEKSDIITLHCDLNPTSKHILNEISFNKMKKSPYIINTARGGLINQEDLIDALDKCQVSGAGLDVFENEPDIDCKLLNMDNVIMLSHNSNNSPKFWNNVHDNSIKMLKENI